MNLYEYTIAWTKIKHMMETTTDTIYSPDGTADKVAIYTIKWNYRTWHWTDEAEAWKFANYWGLL